jgi:hypothetical protein
MAKTASELHFVFHVESGLPLLNEMWRAEDERNGDLATIISTSMVEWMAKDRSSDGSLQNSICS